MKNLLYSKSLLYVLAALLLLTFFLPDIIGPVPALMISAVVIGVALLVYNKWSRLPPDNGPPHPEDGDDPPDSDSARR